MHEKNPFQTQDSQIPSRTVLYARAGKDKKTSIKKK